MEKSYSNTRITVAIGVLVIILYPMLLPTLAHGQQQQQQQDLFPFSFPILSTATKNQTSINTMHNHDIGSHSFSDYSKKAENSNANVNYNDNSGHKYNSNNAIANDNVDNTNNPSADSSSNNNNNNNNYVPKAVILNFYDNDIGQFTNAKPILDKYGFKGGGDALTGRAVLIDAPIGKGHVVMFANRPFWRWQTQGNFFLGFNTILNWNDLDSGRSTSKSVGTGAQ